MIVRLTFLVSFFLCNTIFAQLNDCSVCSIRLIENNLLEEKSLEELILLRNEIYARKGYVFKELKFSRYFEKQSWYKPHSSNDEIALSSIETKNVQLIKKIEEIKRTARTNALEDLNTLKQALLKNDSVVINRFAGEVQKSKGFNEFLQVLKEIMLKVELDQVHWNKKGGLYKNTIDNGYARLVYEIIFEEKLIFLRKSQVGNSEIFGTFDDGYSDYQSESEYLMFWLFEFDENGIHVKYFTEAN